MEMSRQERIALHDRLVVKLDDVRRSLMSQFPEIVSVDLGLKESHGRITDQFAWRIFVQQKKAPSDLQPGEMIPKEYAGLPTDVFQHRVANVEDDDASYSPFWGGIQITGSGGTGTLGCFVHLVGDTKVHILSNHHVLMGSSGAVGDLVGQPSKPCDLCCCKCCDVAKVVNGIVGTAGGGTNNVDCAIAILNGQTPGDSKTVYYSNNIISIGPVFGSGVAAVGDIVRKRGRTTLLTTGIITSITASPTINTNPGGTAVNVTYNNQLDISPTGGSTDWSDGGDSGSAVVNNLNQVVGLHFAGGGNTGNANIISNVTSRLGIEVLSSGTMLTVPLSGIAEAPIVTAHPAHFLRKIELKLQETECGKEFLQAIHENHREVLDLINDNREVKVAWNRFQGPAFVGHFAKNANEPQHRIPREVDGYSLQNLLIKMNDVLERNGSRKLAQAVEDYAQTAFQFATDYAGIDSLDAMVQRGDFCRNCGTLKNGMHYA